MPHKTKIARTSIKRRKVLLTAGTINFASSVRFITCALMIAIAFTTFVLVSNESSTPASLTPVLIVSSNSTATLNTTISETTSNYEVQNMFRVDRWDWSTWNTMDGLALWITNTATAPLDVFSLSITIDGYPAEVTLYPGPLQTCPLNLIPAQTQCLLMPTPAFHPMKGNSYTVIITSPYGTQTTLNATYGERSDEPNDFTVDDVSWTPTCCNYTLKIQITNTGAGPLDTDRLAAAITLNDNSPTAFNACDSIAQATICNLTFNIETFTSYVVEVTDLSSGLQVYLLTPG